VPEQLGPLSSTPLTQVTLEQLAPEKTEILLSQVVAHKEAVIIDPSPVTVYQTPGIVWDTPQV
jgi:hypothetical protein